MKRIIYITLAGLLGSVGVQAQEERIAEQERTIRSLRERLGGRG